MAKMRAWCSHSTHPPPPRGGQAHPPGPLHPHGAPLWVLYTTLFPWGGFSYARFPHPFPWFQHNRRDSCLAVTWPLHQSPPEKLLHSAVPVLPHEGHDARRGPGQLKEWVSQQFLRRGSLWGFPHQHQVQEAPEDRRDLQHHAGIRSRQWQDNQHMLSTLHVIFLVKTTDSLSFPETKIHWVEGPCIVHVESTEVQNSTQYKALYAT